MGVADTSGISYIDANLFYCTYFLVKTNFRRRQEYLAVAVAISQVSDINDGYDVDSLRIHKFPCSKNGF